MNFMLYFYFVILFSCEYCYLVLFWPIILFFGISLLLNIDLLDNQFYGLLPLVTLSLKLMFIVFKTNVK